MQSKFKLTKFGILLLIYNHKCLLFNYLIFALLYCHTLWFISSVFFTNYPSPLLAWGGRLFGREGGDFELYKISDLDPHSFAAAGQEFIILAAFSLIQADT
jgi:hypothetical protein